MDELTNYQNQLELFIHLYKGAGKDWKKQPFSDVMAKQRAWELKSSYMTYLINHKKSLLVAQLRECLSHCKRYEKNFTQLLLKKRCW